MTAIFTVLIIFLYDWSFNGILCINEDEILALHKAILSKLYLVGMYFNGFLREAWNSLSSFTMVSLIFNEHQF